MNIKKSYLFVTWEGGGNLPPVLGLAQRLIARGHKVRVLSEPCLRNTIESLGAEFVVFKKLLRIDGTYNTHTLLRLFIGREKGHTCSPG